MKTKMTRRFLLLIASSSFIFIVLGTMSYAEKGFYVIPTVKEVIVNEKECMTWDSIETTVNGCRSQCDGTHLVDEQVWACYNGCSITGGILKVNYLCQ